MLKVNNITVNYGHIEALRGLSLEINEGEIVAIIGPNGAGKTTLLMTISGILRPKSGTIEFLERRIDTLPTHKIVELGIGHIPQGRQLFPAMTVADNLLLGAYRVRNVEAIQPQLERVYSSFEVLRERSNQRAGTLSGGEQQQLAIGRGLMAMPKLLLLDEPTWGLAPLVVENIALMINNLRKEGLTLLLVEQNAHIALDIADRGYVLQTGSITASGRSSELKQMGVVKRAYLGGT